MGVGDAVDRVESGGIVNPSGLTTLATGVLMVPPAVVPGPGDLDDTRPSVRDLGRKIADLGEPGRLAIEEEEHKIGLPGVGPAVKK